MKKLKIICALLFTSLTIISCSNDDDSTPNPTETNFFKAKIESVPFNATVPEFGASKSGNIITIACVQGIHKFQLKINNILDDGVGTYTIPASTANTIVLTYENDVVVYESGICGSAGSLTITSINSNVITGTFTFSADNTDDCTQPQKNINQGSFRAILAAS